MIGMNTSPKMSFMICTQQRSGSWLLSEALEHTGVAGRPKEYYLELYEKEWTTKWGTLTSEEYLSQVLRAGTTPSGIFSIKVHWYQFELMIPKLRQIPRCSSGGVNDALANAFPNLKYVWLKRLNKPRQAISHFRAIKSGQWWKIEGHHGARNSASDFQLDFDEVRRLENFAVLQDASWQKFFTDAGIEPLVITYEDLMQSLEGALMRLFSQLGIDLPPETKLHSPRLKRQSDGLTEQWLEKYLQEKKRAPEGEIGIGNSHLKFGP